MNSVRFVFSRRNTPPPISLKNVIRPMILSFSQNYTMNSVRFVFLQNLQDLVGFSLDDLYVIIQDFLGDHNITMSL